MFKNCETLEEVKRCYRQLAKTYHPDKGGSVEKMQQINAAYEIAFKKAGLRECAENINTMWGIEQVVIDKIDAISHLHGIMIELVGRWVWVSGDTRPVKDDLKAEGFFWARKKKCWFWRLPADRSRNRKDMRLEAIREKYGSKVVKSPSFTTPLA